jgi:tRNA threonylcarbamoyl adenosine modification protein YeaZ
MTRSSPWILGIDTATSRVVVAAGDPDGRLLAERGFPAEHRHGERLLATIEELTEESGLAMDALSGIVVGTGPGAFTGLRVGLATAKTLGHELGLPVAGVSTAEALLAAAGGGTLVALPAGMRDRVEVHAGQPPRLVAAAEAQAALGEGAIAVDLEGRADAAALDRGRLALEGLAAALLRAGAERLRSGGDDPERLVPEYVTLPRGAAPTLNLEEGVEWSHDRR